MLRKRLIGVVTVKNGWAVQSMGYRRYLPLGKPECLVENLDRWGADEILLQSIDRSRNQLSPDFEMIERIAGLGLETPLIYGGGIRTVAEGVEVIRKGTDRIVVDALLHDDLGVVRGLSSRLGAQAIIASLPVSRNEQGLQWLDHRRGDRVTLSSEVLDVIETRVVSEVLLIDWMHEGQRQSFDQGLVKNFPVADAALIAFGGISDPAQMMQLLQMEAVSAVAIGNFLNYREHSIQKLREHLASLPLRPSVYESRYIV